METLATSRVWHAPLVTELVPAGTFYPGGVYQRYFERNPNQGYCRAIIVPKVAKLRQHYLEKLKS